MALLLPNTRDQWDRCVKRHADRFASELSSIAQKSLLLLTLVFIDDHSYIRASHRLESQNEGAVQSLTLQVLSEEDHACVNPFQMALYGAFTKQSVEMCRPMFENGRVPKHQRRYEYERIRYHEDQSSLTEL